jgi:hypothetical protein
LYRYTKDIGVFKKESSFITRLYQRYKIDRSKIEILPQEYQIWLQRRYKYCHQFPSTVGALYKLDPDLTYSLESAL